MLVAALIVIVGFIVLAGFRLAGARRRAILTALEGGRVYAVLLALAAVAALTRGAFALAVGVGLAALLTWVLSAQQTASTSNGPESSPRDLADDEARALLGLGLSPTTAQIRAAYRTKMAQAHPDRGGDPAFAARLTAARDRLLQKF